MPSAAINVDYVELQGSPTETLGGGGYQAQRRLKVAWTDRLLLAQQLLGHQNLTTLVFYLPDTMPGNPSAYCHHVSIAPFTGDVVNASSTDSRAGTYAFAELTADYQIDPLHRTGSGSEVFSETLEISKEALTLPTLGLYFDAAMTQRLPDGANPSLLLPMATWVYTRHRVRTIPQASVDCIGLVNQGAMTPSTLGLTFESETLLFEDLSLQRVYTTAGTLGWDVTHRFVHRPNGWNNFYNPATGTFDPIYNAGGLYKPFPLGDFSPIQVG